MKMQPLFPLHIKMESRECMIVREDMCLEVGNASWGGPHLYYPALEESSELEVTDIEETVVYIGFLMSHYGHMITDGSICLWGLFELPSNLPIAYIPEGSVLPKHYIELFKLLGINTDRFLEIHSPVRFQKVYLMLIITCLRIFPLFLKKQSLVVKSRIKVYP